MSIHTILSQIDSQEIYELMQSYRHMPITEQELTVKAFEDVKQWVRSFATRIVEEVGKELIGEDEYELNTWESPEVIERNLFRKSMRTKLQKMKENI